MGRDAADAAHCAHAAGRRLADPKIKARLTDLGGEALSLSPPAFAKLIADETDKWGKVIKATGMKPE